MAFELTHAVVQRLWDVNHLGRVDTLARSTRGINNPGALVNDALFLRVDGLTDWDVSRFAGEARAYDRLKATGIPVPEIVALDTSHRFIPHDYMIMTKVSGRPVIDCWPALNAVERQRVAYEAGEYLARLHQVQFPQYGKMYDLPAVGFDTWPEVVEDFYRNYRNLGIEKGALSPELVAHMDAMMQNMAPALAAVTEKGLIHGDYHFENILQDAGQVTGILDFEWSKVGDGSWDFKVDTQWERECPGSRDVVYAGYQAVRPLDEMHPARSTLYRILMLLDDVVELFGVPGSQRSADALALMLPEMARLESLSC
jgi:aminoglycoside phosphotransferase (APT) family kinase protein